MGTPESQKRKEERILFRKQIRKHLDFLIFDSTIPLIIMDTKKLEK
jgi:hypothetical protein